MKQHGYIIVINHIKAHQTTPTEPDDPLHCAIALNKEADWLADSAHIKHILPHNPTSSYPAGRVQISCQNEPVYDGIHKKTRDVNNDETLILYLQERFKWSTCTFDTIWWSIHGKTLQRYKPIQRLVLQKFCMDHWACNHRVAVRGDEEMKWCDVCHHTEETSAHILQCNHIQRQAAREELLKDIARYMKRTGTSVEIHECIVQGLQAWLAGNEPPQLETIVQNPSFTLRKAYTTQHTIGWRHFFKGRLSIHWSTLVNGDNLAPYNENEVSTIPKNRNPESWGGGLINVLWQHVLKFWKLRNDSVVELYKQRGMTKEQFITIRAAIKEQQSGAVSHQHQDWFNKTQEEFRQMDIPSLKTWIRRIRACKKSFQKLSQQGQGNLLCYQQEQISLRDITNTMDT